uniref:Ufm1-specific protease 2 n=1 Tax=Lygus hesperus TaxID=30085 RepID=A0A0K8SSF5_LYGHE
MSAPNFKIIQKLEDRLTDIAETVGQCSVTLYGTKFEGSVLIVGFSIENEAKLTVEHNNPYGIDVVGLAEVRKNSSEVELCEKLKSVPCKYPVVINVSVAGSLKARRLVDGKLTSSSFDVLEDDEFLENFMFVNFVEASVIDPAPAKDDSADPAEEATELSSNPNFIKNKLNTDRPIFRIPHTENEMPNDVVPFEVYTEIKNDDVDPRLPVALAILTLQVDLSYDSKFLRKVEGKDEKLNNINTVCLVLKEDSVNLNEIFIGSILRNLKIFENELRAGNVELQEFSSYIFFPVEVGYVVTAVFPVNAPEEEFFKRRLILHECLGLTTASPKFTLPLALSHIFGGSPALGYTGERHLVNVHEAVKPPKLRDVQISTVRGFYGYFHYMQDGEKDDGWGCAYRSLQTIFSWFRWQGYVSSQVPSIKEIQEILVRIKDKPESFVGSKQWIGSQELCYVLDETAKVMCRIIHVPSGKGMLDERYAIAAHFEEQGTPIMVGGGQYAYTILGIACGETPNETRFLILDPHYVGPHDLKSILKKNGIAWKAVDMFKNGQFYNMCLPLASSTF